MKKCKVLILLFFLSFLSEETIAQYHNSIHLSNQVLYTASYEKGVNEYLFEFKPLIMNDVLLLRHYKNGFYPVTSGRAHLENIVNWLTCEAWSHRVNGEIKQSKHLFQKGLNISLEASYEKGKAYALFGLGMLEYDSENYNKPLHVLKQSLKIQKHIDDKMGIAATSGSIGNVYNKLSDHQQAAKYYLQEIVLHKEMNDRTYYKILSRLGSTYAQMGNFHDAIQIFRETLTEATRERDSIAMAVNHRNLGCAYESLGLMSKALYEHKRAVNIRKNLNDAYEYAGSLIDIAAINRKQGAHETAIHYLSKALVVYQSLDRPFDLSVTNRILGDSHMMIGDTSEAVYHYSEGLLQAQSVNAKSLIASSCYALGMFYSAAQQYEKSLEYFGKAYNVQIDLEEELSTANTLISMGEVYLSMDNLKKSLEYIWEGVMLAERIEEAEPMIRAEKLLAKNYASTGNSLLASEAIRLCNTTIKTLRNKENSSSMNQMEAPFKPYQVRGFFVNDHLHQQVILDKERTEISIQRKLILAKVIIVILMVLFLAIFYVQLRIGKIARKRKEELEVAKKKIITITNDLSVANSHLVQSEKMVSLGMLTAGIAHEINNPINFIHVGIQTLDKRIKMLEGYLGELGMSDAKTEKLLTSIKELSESAGHGAIRTAEIVKGLRSFAHSDEKQMMPVDLRNTIETALTVLSSSIHENVKVIKEFEEVPPIQGYAGKLSQVFLNILINAIQAIGDREQGILNIKLLSEESKVIVKIKDNGGGIPTEIQEKIFQPFFTTKPIGEGTGLGLSISYTIIKQHLGDLSFTTTEDEGTEFVLTFSTN